jgi:hypothetical protein
VPTRSLTPFGKTRETPAFRHVRAPGSGLRATWDNARCAAQDTPAMDIERTNAIGTLLADLSARTEALRGYL